MHIINLRKLPGKAFNLALTLLILVSACKKNSTEPDTTDDTDNIPPTSGTREELTKDSIYLYAKGTYFWNEVLPSYKDFNPRQYTSSDEAVLNAFTGLKINPTTGQPIDKYSFLDDGTLADELGGSGGDFGFSVFFNSQEDLRIKYVYANSPAGRAGLKRGYRITKINNSTNINSDSDASLDFIVDAVFGSESVTMTVLKPDNSSQEVTINTGFYSINPVLYSNVYTVGSKKVGYFVFNSFTTNAAERINTLFSDFAAAGVTEVIIDLRYNGGGSVATADTLVDYMAPASQAGNTMYTTYWTKTMQNGQADVLKNQPYYNSEGQLDPDTRGHNGKFLTYFDFNYSPENNIEKFQKAGTANITRAYFLVTGSTASASELVINNLKPVMDVKLIGRKTYGKPVGFFELVINRDNATGYGRPSMYIPQFQTKNSQNEGDYFDGIPVDREEIDDVTKEFGDPTERYLALALNYVQTGAFAVSNKIPKLASTKPLLSKTQADHITTHLDEGKFKGMIETPRKLKPKQ